MGKNLSMNKISLFFHVLRKFVAIFLSICLILLDSVALAQTFSSTNPSKIPTDHDITSPHFSLPEALGTVDESSIENTEKIILYIQDAHDSLEAQDNIAKIIHYAVNQQGVRTVYEEGYEGSVPTDDFFGFIEDPEVKDRVSYFLLDQLRIGGAEYAHINRQRDFRLIGADSIQLHLQNIEWYQETEKYKEKTSQDLKAIQKHMTKLTHQYFPSELKTWMKYKKRFDQNQLNLFDYLKRTAKLYLKKVAKEELLMKYPLISLLIVAGDSKKRDVLERVNKIEAQALFREIDALENDFASINLTNETARKIFQYYKGITLIQRLNDLEVTPAEFAAVHETLQQLHTEELAPFIAQKTKKSIVLSKRWEEKIHNAIRFYETAQARDHALEAHLDSFLNNAEEKSGRLGLRRIPQNEHQRNS